MKYIKRIFCLNMTIVLLTSLLLPVTVWAAGNTKAIAISKKTAAIYVGQTLKLKVTGAESAVKWGTSDKKIATVTQKGVVKAIKAGKATITAKAGKNSLKCALTVKNASLSKTSLSINYGKTATVALRGAKIKSVKSSNKAVATIDKNGKITAKKVGAATVTVTGTNNKKYTCKVKVKAYLTKTNLTLNCKKTAAIALKGAKIKSVKSSDKAIATIDKNGKITAKKAGSATITVTDTKNGKYTCKVKVTSSLTEKKHTHSYTYKTVAPTCTKKGYTKLTCKCGVVKKKNYTDALGHSFGNFIITKQPTTSSAGKKQRKCSVCGKVETETIAKLSATTKTTLTPAEKEMLRLINESRKEAGLKALTFNYAVYDCAEIRVKELTMCFDHIRPHDGTSFVTVFTDKGVSGNYNYFCENIGANMEHDPDIDISVDYAFVKDTHNGFMESPGHRANILNPKVTSVAFAFYDTDYFTYTVELFLG